MTAPVRLRTSRDSPLGIDELLLGPGEGRLGLTICPGKKDRSRQWDRDLGEDMKVIRDWGATTVVTLIEDDEFRLLGIEDLGAAVRRHGIAWVHLPIRDIDVPDDRFERAWAIDGPALHRRIDRGEGILIHCRGGLGRTGLVAGLILVERGVSPPEAIDRVRAARPHAIETWAQEGYVLNAKPREAPQDEGSSPWGA